MKRRRMIRQMFCGAFALAALITGFSRLPARGADLPSRLELTVARENLTVQKGHGKQVAVTTVPESIETGVDCGMPDMCGIDPCLCGSCDTWGSCSCNGLKRTVPTVTATASDPGLLSVRVNDGKVLIKGLKEGKGAVTVTASLTHYQTVSKTIAVEVKPDETWKLLAAGGAFSAALAAAFLIARKGRNRRDKRR